MRCRASPGYIVANAERIVEIEKPWAVDGTNAHTLAALTLRGEPLPEIDGIKFTDEMVQSAKEWAEFVRDKMDADSTLVVEKKVPLFYMPGRNGYVDAGVFSPAKIYIPDFKNGEGVSVEAEQNEQCAIYAMSLIRWLEQVGLCEFTDETLVTLAIFQPRARDKRKVRLWAISYADLVKFTNEINGVAQAIQLDPKNQPFCVDDKVCQFCPLKDGLCEVRANALLGDMPPAVTKPLGDVLNLPDVGTFTDEQIGRIVRAQKPLEKFLEAVRTRAFAMLNAGKDVPGLKLVEGKTSRAWTDEEEAKKLLKSAKLTVDDYSPRSFVSPAGAEGLLKGRELSTRFQNRFKEIVRINPGKPTMVSADDERQPLLVKPEQVFKNVTPLSGVELI